MTFLNLILTDVRRALHRRVLRVLLAIAGTGAMIVGISAFVSAAGKTPDQLHLNGAHPAIMADWWLAPSPGDSILMIAVIPLLIGGFIGGAAIVGGEWRAGTVATMLTFEPRRAHLHAARLAAGLVLAVGLAFMLQVLFLSATLPAVLTRGTTAGTASAWWAELGLAVTRISLLTAAAGLLGVSLATLGRNTAFAMGVMFAWMTAAEGIIRSYRPGLHDYLLGENLAVTLTWAPLGTADVAQSELAAAVTVAAYVALVVAAGMLTFLRRDIHGVSG